MKLRDAGYALLAIAVIVASSATVAFKEGVTSGTAASATKVEKAQAAASGAQAQVDALATTLDQVNQSAERARLQAAADKALWTQAMAENTKLRAANQLLAKKKTEDVLKVGHEDPDCADLARLPICPAVADRLWPEASGGEDSPGGGSTHPDQ